MPARLGRRLRNLRLGTTTATRTPKPTCTYTSPRSRSVSTSSTNVAPRRCKASSRATGAVAWSRCHVGLRHAVASAITLVDDAAEALSERRGARAKRNCLDRRVTPTTGLPCSGPCQPAAAEDARRSCTAAAARAHWRSAPRWRGRRGVIAPLADLADPSVARHNFVHPREGAGRSRSVERPGEERPPGQPSADADAPPSARLRAVSRRSGPVKRPGDRGLCGAALKSPAIHHRSFRTQLPGALGPLQVTDSGKLSLLWGTLT